MNRWLRPALVCIALGPVAAGCGSDDKKERGPGADKGAKPTEQVGGGGGRDVTVVMKDVKNVPMEVVVRKGGTVEWKNEDPFPHTVTKQAGPGPGFDSGSVKGGATFKQKFKAAGRIKYHCEIHPNQTGSITVQ
jgi:plastocyanin